MATPHVSGAALLVLSACQLSTTQLRTALLQNTDAISGLSGYTSTGGRLNVAKALASCAGSGSKPSYSLTPGAGSVVAGSVLSVSWTAPGQNGDWIGLFPVGGSNRIWWQYTGGTNSGTLNLTAPLQAGQYEFRYFLQGSGTEAARSSPITVTAGATAYSVTASPSTVAAGGTLTVSWTAPAGRPTNDWVALCVFGNTYCVWGQYTGGTTSGTFSLTAPTPIGQYEFRYLLQGGYTEAGHSSPVTVR